MGNGIIFLFKTPLLYIGDTDYPKRYNSIKLDTSDKPFSSSLTVCHSGVAENQFLLLLIGLMQFSTLLPAQKDRSTVIPEINMFHLIF
jgi:hypothetical protein